MLFILVKENAQSKEDIQKIIEESPSPRITEEIRFAMGNAAVDLAKK